MNPILRHVPNKLSHFIFACILFISIIYHIFLTLTAFIPLRLFVRLCAQLFRPDLLNFMAGTSAIFATDNITTRPEVNIAFIPVFDGPTNLQKLRSIFRHRVLEHRRPNGKLMYAEFKQYWTSFMYYSFWVKDVSFDLNDHIRLYDYGNGGSKELILDADDKGFCDEEDLNRLLGPLLRQPWRQGKSPWEFLLIPHFKSSRDSGLTGKLGSAFIFRVHHTMCDGYSILKILHRCMDVDYPKPLANFRKKSLLHKFLFTFIFPFKYPWDLAAFFIRAFDGPHCWTRHGSDSSTERKVWTSLSKPIDMQLIKSIKNKYGVGYNDVLSAVAEGSCMKLMKDAGQVIPKEVSCFMPYPLPGHPDGLVNHTTSFNILWSMDNSKSRETRLRMMSERMAVSSFYTVPTGNKFMTDLGSFLPNALFAPFRGFINTIVVSSIPGLQGEITANGLGTKMFDLIGCLGPGIGIGGTTMFFISANGKQRFVNCIDRASFPNGVMAANFGKYVEEELFALWKGKERKTNFINRTKSSLKQRRPVNG